MDAARPGARFAYWNTLVPRLLSASFPGRVRFLEDESRDLFARDLAFFYGAFVVKEMDSEKWSLIPDELLRARNCLIKRLPGSLLRFWSSILAPMGGASV